MADITFNGMTMAFDIVASLMDADIKIALMKNLGDCSEHDLLDAYMAAHKEKYGDTFLQG